MIACASGFLLTWFFGFTPERLAELNTGETGAGGLTEAEPASAPVSTREEQPVRT